MAQADGASLRRPGRGPRFRNQGRAPQYRGEEIALHLGIARAEALTRNRPRLLQEVLAGLPEDRRDFDWDAC
ncbi:hypothetical protein ACWGI8_37950 [Streptomyces sp. NPDC054841]